jgi:hypothetical protein
MNIDEIALREALDYYVTGLYDGPARETMEKTK